MINTMGTPSLTMYVLMSLAIIFLLLGIIILVISDIKNYNKMFKAGGIITIIGGVCFWSFVIVGLWTVY